MGRSRGTHLDLWIGWQRRRRGVSQVEDAMPDTVTRPSHPHLFSAAQVTACLFRLTMSRLIVKNLPSYVTPALLKEHFSQSKGPGGTITDVKVALKRDGTARRFGFIGFKTDDEALKAREWYDKTFIDSTRVRVEVIDVSILPGLPVATRLIVLYQGVHEPRPNKRQRLVTPSAEHSATLTCKKTKTPNRKSNSDDSPVVIAREDANFEEFMEVMQSKAKKVVTWADQADSFPSSSKKGKVPATQQRLQDPPQVDVQRDLTDMEWMRQRMKEGIEGVAGPERAPEQSGSEEQDQKISEEEHQTEETILRTGRLFVRNLTFICTEDELRGLFQSFGAISQVS
jgi:multiple RNA-binding domain-containing protein 1